MLYPAVQSLSKAQAETAKTMKLLNAAEVNVDRDLEYARCVAAAIFTSACNSEREGYCMKVVCGLGVKQSPPFCGQPLYRSCHRGGTWFRAGTLRTNQRSRIRKFVPH